MLRIPTACPLAASQIFPALLVKTLHTQRFAVSALSTFLCGFPTFSIRATKLLPVWLLSYGVAIRASFRFSSLFFCVNFRGRPTSLPRSYFCKMLHSSALFPPNMPIVLFWTRQLPPPLLKHAFFATASLGLSMFISHF